MSKYKQQKVYFDKPYHSTCIWRKPYESPDDVVVLRAWIVSKKEYDSHKEEHGECRYVCQDCDYTWKIHLDPDKIMEEKLNRQAEAFKRVVKTINQESNETAKEDSNETPDPAHYIPIDYIKKKVQACESELSSSNTNLADRQFFHERRLSLLSLLSDWDWDSEHHFYHPSPNPVQNTDIPF